MVEVVAAYDAESAPARLRMTDDEMHNFMHVYESEVAIAIAEERNHEIMLEWRSARGLAGIYDHSLVDERFPKPILTPAIMSCMITIPGSGIKASMNYLFHVGLGYLAETLAHYAGSVGDYAFSRIREIAPRLLPFVPPFPRDPIDVAGKNRHDDAAVPDASGSSVHQSIEVQGSGDEAIRMEPPPKRIIQFSLRAVASRRKSVQPQQMRPGPQQLSDAYIPKPATPYSGLPLLLQPPRRRKSGLYQDSRQEEFPFVSVRVAAESRSKSPEGASARKETRVSGPSGKFNWTHSPPHAPGEPRLPSNQRRASGPLLNQTPGNGLPTPEGYSSGARVATGLRRGQPPGRHARHSSGAYSTLSPIGTTVPRRHNVPSNLKRTLSTVYREVGSSPKTPRTPGGSKIHFLQQMREPNEDAEFDEDGKTLRKQQQTTEELESYFRLQHQAQRLNPSRQHSSPTPHQAPDAEKKPANNAPGFNALGGMKRSMYVPLNDDRSAGPNLASRPRGNQSHSHLSGPRQEQLPPVQGPSNIGKKAKCATGERPPAQLKLSIPPAPPAFYTEANLPRPPQPRRQEQQRYVPPQARHPHTMAPVSRSREPPRPPSARKSIQIPALPPMHHQRIASGNNGGNILKGKQPSQGAPSNKMAVAMLHDAANTPAKSTLRGQSGAPANNTYTSASTEDDRGEGRLTPYEAGSPSASGSTNTTERRCVTCNGTEPRGKWVQNLYMEKGREGVYYCNSCYTKDYVFKKAIGSNDHGSTQATPEPTRQLPRRESKDHDKVPGDKRKHDESPKDDFSDGKDQEPAIKTSRCGSKDQSKSVSRKYSAFFPFDQRVCAACKRTGADISKQEWRSSLFEEDPVEGIYYCNNCHSKDYNSKRRGQKGGQGTPASTHQTPTRRSSDEPKVMSRRLSLAGQDDELGDHTLPPAQKVPLNDTEGGHKLVRKLFMRSGFPHVPPAERTCASCGRKTDSKNWKTALAGEERRAGMYWCKKCFKENLKEKNLSSSDRGTPTSTGSNPRMSSDDKPRSSHNQSPADVVDAEDAEDELAQPDLPPPRQMPRREDHHKVLSRQNSVIDLDDDSAEPPTCAQCHTADPAGFKWRLHLAFEKPQDGVVYCHPCYGRDQRTKQRRRDSLASSRSASPTKQAVSRDQQKVLQGKHDIADNTEGPMQAVVPYTAQRRERYSGDLRQMFMQQPPPPSDYLSFGGLANDPNDQWRPMVQLPQEVARNNYANRANSTVDPTELDPRQLHGVLKPLVKNGIGGTPRRQAVADNLVEELGDRLNDKITRRSLDELVAEARRLLENLAKSTSENHRHETPTRSVVEQPRMKQHAVTVKSMSQRPLAPRHPADIPPPQAHPIAALAPTQPQLPPPSTMLPYHSGHIPQTSPNRNNYYGCTASTRPPPYEQPPAKRQRADAGGSAFAQLHRSRTEVEPYPDFTISPPTCFAPWFPSPKSQGFASQHPPLPPPYGGETFGVPRHQSPVPTPDFSGPLSNRQARQPARPMHPQRMFSPAPTSQMPGAFPQTPSPARRHQPPAQKSFPSRGQLSDDLRYVVPKPQQAMQGMLNPLNISPQVLQREGMSFPNSPPVMASFTQAAQSFPSMTAPATPVLKPARLVAQSTSAVTPAFGAIRPPPSPATPSSEPKSASEPVPGEEEQYERLRKQREYNSKYKGGKRARDKKEEREAKGQKKIEGYLNPPAMNKGGGSGPTGGGDGGGPAGMISLAGMMG